ncbi:hypothetical protein AAC387_Pa04g2637 [Persea americana]
MLSNRPVISLLFLLNISIYLPINALNSEGQTLVSWLSAFNSSPTSSLFSSWNPAHKNPCSWSYITCSTDGSVSEFKIKSINLPTTFPTQLLTFSSLTTLIISNANLTGLIPPSIANLSSSLTTLDLSYNALTGNIPPDIGKLSELRFLSLNSNSLIGEIPPQISNCSNLQRLELFDNRFSGKVPAELGRLFGLEVFRAGGNAGIHGEIPSEISNCQGLLVLGLADTAVSGEIPVSFGQLRNLRILSIYTTDLSGKIPSEIGNCSSLENLYLYENRLIGEIPPELGMLKNLKKVFLWKNNLTGSIPEALGNCTGLTVMDLSLNSLSGEIPQLFSNLEVIEELLLSYNNISGRIPPFFGNFSRLKQLELDNNGLSGEIPTEIGRLKELTQFFAWQNQLHGSIPSELGDCEMLELLDLSHNFLTGSLPNSLFNLKNLTKLMLISNGFSGEIPPDIGNCSSLIRLRLGSNRFSGRIPPEIGLLRSLSFLELSENQLLNEIPPEIGNCTQLEMLDLHDNRLQGAIPTSIEYLVSLNVLDLSMNRISGSVPESLGNLTTLNKLLLNGNYITGLIPKLLGLCKDLQLLDMSSNRISGSIPDEIGNLQGLDILLNLSWNYLSGPIPEGISRLSKLANLDLSHNMLTGSLSVLVASLAGNRDLCTSGDKCFVNVSDAFVGKRLSGRISRNGIFGLVFSIGVAVVFLIIGLVLMFRAWRRVVDKKEEERLWEWEITPFQKLRFSIDDVLMKLLDSNVIGQGSSGKVYRVETRTGQVIAVKKIWPTKNCEFSERDSFSAEVKTLGSIRHKNIVRLLGCCTNKNTRLLLYDYISHGSLAGVLHEKKIFLDWDSRYKIVLGAAQGLAYLHHDCIPPIVHRDIKANNILIGLQFEAYLADFGLAKVIDSDHTKSSNAVAGSYGYIAPEYGYSMKITEKSDIYSYGVVLLEVLTGMQPTDPRIPEGTHIVNWVRKELRKKDRETVDILDRQLQGQPDSHIQEMLQVLGVALLCVNPSPEERPTMKDVAALLEEIRQSTEDSAQDDASCKGYTASPKADHCSSFSRPSQPLMRSPSFSYSSSSSRVIFE